MGLRFRKSVKIAPGIRLNMGTRGITSVTLGTTNNNKGLGLSTNISKSGTRKTVSARGTGLSYTTKKAKKR